MKAYIVGKTQQFLLHRQEVHPGGFAYGMPGKAFRSNYESRFNEDTHWGKTYWNQSLIEFAGRLCYESWDMPNPTTANQPGYLKNIISQGHESVLEHVSVTFYVEGVSRNLSHELIRHRHLSFSELSQRFVDMSEANRITPPVEGGGMIRLGRDEARLYEERVEYLMEKGSTRKQAREAARFYLRSGMETKFVVTGNLRAWRDVLKKRDSEHADAEMQLLAKEVKRQLLEEYPDVFADLDGNA